jgi:predicted GNAT family acetyltransferase
VQLERHPDATSFLERAGDFLLEREAQHNLILGLSSRLRTEPRLYGEDPYFASVSESDRVVGVVMRTPPHNLILSMIDDDRALDLIAEDAREVFGGLPGVVGPKEPVAKFARLWHEPAEIGIRQRVYRASRASPPEGVSGSMRAYEEADRELVIGWMDAFVEEALPSAPPEDSEHWVDRNQSESNPDGGLELWIDEGRPVSFAGYGGLTPNGIRIGPVYTPPELRGRGYGSAVTARVTKDQLESGRDYCFLYTDLSNPTSNRIYVNIGYERVCDSAEYAFEAA